MRLASQKETGGYRFNGHLADLRATPGDGKWNIRVHFDGEFILKVALGGSETKVLVHPGTNSFAIPR